MANELVKNSCTYETAGGDHLSLSPATVKKYLVNGDAKNITDQEIKMFLGLCKFQKLNPFTREVYLIKYGDNPATMVVGKDVFIKRARRQPDFRGFEAGVTVRTKDGEVISRTGSLVDIEKETLLGGWAKVYLEGYRVPIEASVGISEYGQNFGNWKKRPCTMIRKVALVQALREAFPVDLAGLYDQSEMQKEIGEDRLPETEVEMTTDDDTETLEAEVIEEEQEQNQPKNTAADILFG